MEEEETPETPDSRLRFARGGPIYAPDLVGALTSVFDFKATVLQHLQDLEEHLDSAGNFDDELSVNDLKVFTEEELVEKALREEFEDIPGIINSLQSSELTREETENGSCISGKEIVCLGDSAVEESNPGPCASLNNSSTLPSGEQTTQQKKRKKRGRFFDRNCRASELEA